MKSFIMWWIFAKIELYPEFPEIKICDVGRDMTWLGTFADEFPETGSTDFCSSSGQLYKQATYNKQEE